MHRRYIGVNTKANGIAAAYVLHNGRHVEGTVMTFVLDDSWVSLCRHFGFCLMYLVLGRNLGTVKFNDNTCQIITWKLTCKFFHHALAQSDDTSTGHLPNAAAHGA
jgi:hypothetical protein